jgi:proteasome accessory factor B
MPTPGGPTKSTSVALRTKWQFEVSAKTIQRDIEFMRDRWRLPIEWDGERNGYRYTEPVENLPLATITEGELVALLVAQKAIEQFKGTSFEAPLVQAFAKFTQHLDGPITVALGEARAAITFKPIGVGRADLELFKKLSEAVLHSTEIEFDYRSLQSDKAERRRLQPWHLCCVDNQWYVIGYDLARKAKRTFALTRIRGAKATRRTFVRPREFSIQEHLGSAFGVFAGTGDHVVRLRFEGWAARLVSERFWHESQKLTTLPDGQVELELRLSGLEEIERWILSFGEYVEVLAPESLRTRIAAVGRRLASRHATKASQR